MHRRRQLGQFFTPPEVIRLMFDLVWADIKDRESPRIIDPACGDGLFLLEGIERLRAAGKEFESSRIVGCDIDRSLEQDWDISGLADFAEMHPGRNALEDEQEGPICDTPIEDGTFDLAIGNPPYGGAYKGIEVRFAKKFLQLVRPGGYVAIILPDGILASANTRAVRRFISESAKVQAIVSLPRGVFDSAGTKAKTSILILEKNQRGAGSDSGDVQSQPVFLAEAGSTSGPGQDLDEIARRYAGFLSQDRGFNRSEHRTLGDLMRAMPYSRWDPHYWRPDFVELERRIKAYPGGYAPLRSLLEGEEVLTCDHVRSSRGESTGEFRTAYYTVDWIMPTGYNTNQLVYCSDNAYERLRRSALRERDIAIAGSGRGSVGKSFVYMGGDERAVVGDLFVLRPKNISPYFLQVFLQSGIGQLQIERHESGVSGQTHINRQEIGSFLVPLVPDRIRKQVESAYVEVVKLHGDAMSALGSGDKETGDALLVRAGSVLDMAIIQLEDELGF